MLGNVNGMLDELRSSIQALRAQNKTVNDSFQEKMDRATQEKMQGEERSLQARRTKVIILHYSILYILNRNQLLTGGK